MVDSSLASQENDGVLGAVNGMCNQPTHLSVIESVGCLPSWLIDRFARFTNCFNESNMGNGLLI